MAIYTYGLRALIGLGLAYAALVALVYLVQDRLLFFPQTKPFKECDLAAVSGFETVDAKKDGHEIRLFLRETPGARGWLIMFHGNGSTACDSIYYWDGLRQLPLNFVFAEYPGYQGDGLVRPSQALLLENAVAVYDYLAARNNGRLPVLLMGESLGTGVATYLASLRAVAGLVLRTPYTSIADVGAGHYPFLPVRWLTRNPFPAAEWASAVKCPVLILHGTRDSTIPIANAKQQAARFPGAAPQFIEIEGADHNDLSEVDPKRFFGAISSLVAQVLAITGK
ncbi:MAG: alpha/beta hydrolase [Deltaproteobacteria bacterium]|nr:alpha/beta hydrolase [Deltaproteobacteria bacterium]